MRKVDISICQQSMIEFDILYLYIILIQFADDQGRLSGHQGFIQYLVSPDGSKSQQWVESGLIVLANNDLITLYNEQNQHWIQINDWWNHNQDAQWAYPSTVPCPDGWMDRMRYRQDRCVITWNWDCGSGIGYSDDSNLYTNLPKGSGKPLPKGSGNNGQYTTVKGQVR